MHKAFDLAVNQE